MQISRSEQKRRIKEVEQLVGELVSLPPQVIERAPFPDEIKLLMHEAAKLEGSTRQRQIKYLTKQIQELPLNELYELVGKHRGKALTERKQLHEMEFYRDALINEALDRRQECHETNTEWTENWTSNTLTELKAHMPEIDILTLSRLSYLFARTRNLRHSREIFRYLRSIQELRQRNSEPKAK